ncbi:hypothetical protein J8273_3473 [Carpediemonas membranifera]|uniref:Uncharacterized protein n=1 Tax=Carpediemonas membranifera TaxID=201153 RepID=A0A8J6DZ98_9EUKA|nr:hypothetical protein J8273_3473 [Carpediemonas membranifera]|eukprot:KAG9393339.1 hypothetical protein J8273_3473 [Carpediemonas membranifera]
MSSLQAAKLTLDDLDSTLHSMQLIAHDIRARMIDLEDSVREKQQALDAGRDILNIFLAPGQLPPIQNRISAEELDNRFSVISSSIEYLSDHREMVDANLFLLRYSQLLSSTFSTVCSIITNSIRRFVENTLSSSRQPDQLTAVVHNPAIAAHLRTLKPLADVLQKWVERYEQLSALEGMVRAVYAQLRRLVEPGLKAEVQRILADTDKNPVAAYEVFMATVALEQKTILSIWTPSVFRTFSDAFEAHVARLKKVARLDAKDVRGRLKTAHAEKVAIETCDRMLSVAENSQSQTAFTAVKVFRESLDGPAK